MEPLIDQPAQGDYFCEKSAQALSRRSPGGEEDAYGMGQKCAGVQNGRQFLRTALGEASGFSQQGRADSHGESFGVSAGGVSYADLSIDPT